MYRNVVDMGYMFHDMMLQQLLDIAGDETTVMLISDHGFHSDHLRPEALPNEPAGPAKEHRDYGIFVATGPDIKAGHQIEGANLLDITPTILTCYGLPTGEDMDGRVLDDIFTNQPNMTAIESWEHVEGDSGEHPPGPIFPLRSPKPRLSSWWPWVTSMHPMRTLPKPLPTVLVNLSTTSLGRIWTLTCTVKQPPFCTDFTGIIQLNCVSGSSWLPPSNLLGITTELRNLLENMSDRWKQPFLRESTCKKLTS